MSTIVRPATTRMPPRTGHGMSASNPGQEQEHEQQQTGREKGRQLGVSAGSLGKRCSQATAASRQATAECRRNVRAADAHGFRVGVDVLAVARSE